MRILVTGRNGQVARSLAERAQGHELFFAERPEFDLTHPESIARTLLQARPELVISAAAYTAVDQAEDEPELARAVNAEAPGELARVAAEIGAPIVHLSTDYVFDGGGDRPWREADQVRPLGVYGSTKLGGEQAIAASSGLSTIVRTAWVYSPFSHNFVKTMLRLAETREELSVVDDQIGCPTSALDLADALSAVADAWSREPSVRLTGTFHLAGSGETSWAGFAEAIFEESRRRGGPVTRVRRVPSTEYPTRAVRPANSRLNSSRFEATFGYRAPAWTQSLGPVVERILSERS